MAKQQFSSHAEAELLKMIKDIARKQGKDFETVLEEAMQEYVERKTNHTPRQEVMAQLKASINKNRKLGELLAQ